ncbi:hypothetical protein F5880DRAFT_1731415 [Lentinula raphanica]|nr:hypothetical protein F5880DRAFT_1731415 [Lentinula raphanica]
MNLFSSFDSPARSNFLTDAHRTEESLPLSGLDSPLNMGPLAQRSMVQPTMSGPPDPLSPPSLDSSSLSRPMLPIRASENAFRPLSAGYTALTPSPESHSNASVTMNAEPEVTPLAVDNLAKDFSLTEEQRLLLQTFLKFGKVGRGLQAADLLTRLYSTAIILHLENKRPKEDENDLQTTRAMINDLRIRLQTFSLSPTQNKLIRLIAHDKIYEPLRTCYMDTGKDVFTHLQSNAEQLGFTNIIGNPAYESALEARVNKICSSVRNQFRQHIIDSITKKPISATDFTHNMNKTYCRPGGPDFNAQHILLRNIILRRFVHERRQMSWVSEEEEIDVDAGDVCEGPTKKRKRGGRVARGQDFWSLVDAWYREKKEELGKRLTEPRWKGLLEEYTRFDEAGFKSPTVPSSSANTLAPMQEVLPSAGSSRGDSTLAALIGI